MEEIAAMDEALPIGESRQKVEGRSPLGCIQSQGCREIHGCVGGRVSTQTTARTTRRSSFAMPNFMFSDKYSIEPLLELVLQKLRLNLSKFELHSQRVGDIVELMKYTYEHTSDYEEAIDRLRSLVADYVVCHIKKIVGFGDFTKLLQENGDVAKDLMPKLMQRMD